MQRIVIASIFGVLLTCTPAHLESQANPSAGRVAIDTAHSTLTVHVFRSGVFSFAGDNHEVRAPIASGSIDAARQTVEFVVQAAQMTVLDPKLDASKRAQVQANMLGPEVLDAQRYPKIIFHSTSVEAIGSDGWMVHGELTLHGVTQPLAIRVSRTGPEYRGSASLTQTAFSIKPIRVAGGTVKVKDEVKVDFVIVTR